jgi:hypothetical protein
MVHGPAAQLSGEQQIPHVHAINACERAAEKLSMAEGNTPDFLADTSSVRWLIDVRPAGRVGDRDLVAAAAEVALVLVLGWRYVVVTGWRRHVMTTLDTISTQRRPLTDPLGLAEVLLDAVAGGPRPFGELAEATVAPVVARAVLLHLLWHRKLAVDLRSPLTDLTPVCTGIAR